MAWNEPGGNKDPWGRKTKNNSEIDTILNDINSFLTGKIPLLEQSICK